MHPKVLGPRRPPGDGAVTRITVTSHASLNLCERLLGGVKVGLDTLGRWIADNQHFPAEFDARGREAGKQETGDGWRTVFAAAAMDHDPERRGLRQAPCMGVLGKGPGGKKLRHRRHTGRVIAKRNLLVSVAPSLQC